MWLTNFTFWLCAALALACSSTPDTSIVQAAYEREASAGSSLHDKGLKILTTKCHGNSAQGFLCEVMFVSTSDPTERLYFDIVAVAQTNDGWKLTSGLCKR